MCAKLKNFPIENGSEKAGNSNSNVNTAALQFTVAVSKREDGNGLRAQFKWLSGESKDWLNQIAQFCRNRLHNSMRK